MNKNLQKGIQLIKEVENEDAVIALKLALDDEPENPEVHRHLGLAFFNLGNIPDAIHHWKRSVALDPTHHLTWWSLGNLYEIERKYNEAYEAYNEATKILKNKNAKKAERYQVWAQKIKNKI
jgi:tetratricopeptide (TPR) repeat protein